jgi:drug/metabolite transporter superfamily protein YnfA
VSVSVPIVLLIIAALLAFADLVRSDARSLTAWGVMAIVASLLWGPRL